MISIPNKNTYSKNIIDQISRYNRCSRSFNDNKNNSRRAHLFFCNSNDHSPPILFNSTNFLSADSPTSLSKFSNISNGSKSSVQRQFEKINRERQTNLVIITEAWDLLAIYIVGQIRFGYELERSLQQQSKKLIKSMSVKTLNNELNIDNFTTNLNNESLWSYIVVNQNKIDEIKKTSEFKENVLKYTESFNSNHIKKKENEVLELMIVLQKNIVFQNTDTIQKSEEKLQISQNINISLKQELIGINN